ncbi:MAG: DUF1634 domain-containing protein [Mucilaginibacter sp.]|nr:DUF1634 domain-containing protein [Mucilaginibacter sp.]
MANLKDTDIKTAIGWVLRIGVLGSIAIVLFGGIIYIYRHGHTVPNYQTFTGVPDFVQPGGIINGILTFRGRAIIQAGIILLIATPIIRVVFSAIGFIIEKDYLYVGITVSVLLIIFISMLSGHAG